MHRHFLIHHMNTRWKRVVSVCLTISLALLVSLPARIVATSASTSGIPWPTDAEEANEDGKWPALSDIQSGAYIVMERASGKVLLEKEADRRLYPASTTKIVTALLGLERLKPDEIVTISAEAVNLPAGYTKVGFKAGEKVVAKDLLAGLMVASGNDAANAVAEAVGGSVEKFAALMNERARKAGATQTNFLNPSGIHQDQHITTARDLAKITAACLSDLRFRELVSLKTCSMPATNLHPYNGWAILTNTNRLMVYGDSYYASNLLTEVIGVKTGYTNAAGDCLIAAAKTADGTELIGVILKVPPSLRDTNKFVFMRTLLEEGAIRHNRDNPSPTPIPSPSPTPVPPTPTPSPTTIKPTATGTGSTTESVATSQPSVTQPTSTETTKKPALAGYLEDVRIRLGIEQTTFVMVGLIIGVLLGILAGLALVLIFHRTVFKRRRSNRR